MRLTAQQQATVRATVLDTFGSEAQVRLFGSRADDNKRGGDIDLLVTTSERDLQVLIRAEIALITKLQSQLEKLRYIQNKYTHDYPDDPDKNAAFINLAIETAQDLVGALADIDKKLRQEHPALILVGKVPLRN